MSESIAEAALRHLHAGRFEQAALALSRALARVPSDPALNSLMCRALASQGRFHQAEYYIARAAAARPDDADILNDLGNCLAMLGRTALAAEVLARAVRLDPAHLGASVSLAAALNSLHRAVEAAEHCRLAAERFGRNPLLAIAHATALLNAARADEAVGVLRDALNDHPGHIELLGRLAFTLNYVPGAPPEQIAAAHRAAGAAITQSTPAVAPPPVVVRSADQPLRIGLLSPDLRTHSVAYFVRPIVENLDPGRFRVCCYSDCPTTAEDALSRRLKSAAAQWRNVAALSDSALAAQIRSDRIDILLELTGYAGRSRLGALALRPAPVVGSYIGYPNTTGVAGVDFRIVDSLTDPPGAEAFATESLVRLDPCFLCYVPPDDAPPVAPPPGENAGHITFGCFNALTKINAPLLALWSRVLAAVPRSTLLLKAAGLDEPALWADLLARAAASGIDPARLQRAPYAPTQAEHLGAYARMDIALDTHPYNGTTTTCEALHMGVPVVSLAGRTHASRVGCSILSAVGSADLAADDAAAYVGVAAGLAADSTRLANLRAGLRGRVRASPLGDRGAMGLRLGELLSRLAAGSPRSRTPTAI